MAQQQQSNPVAPQRIGMPMRGIKRIPNPTAKSLTGEMKVNKVFGTPDIKGAMKVKAPKMPGRMPKKMKPVKPSKVGSPATKASVEKSVRKTMGYYA